MHARAAGDPAPDFTLPGTTGAVRLSDALRDGPVVVTFYQEDSTPACRQQLAALRDDGDLLREAGARVIAIAVDPLERHQQFAAELASPFPLLVDEGGRVAQEWGVWDADARRARRAAFVVGRDGRLLLALPWYSPTNSSQYEQIFRALGLG